MRGLIRKISLPLIFFILTPVQLSTKLIKESPSTSFNLNPPHRAMEVVRDPILTWSSTNATSYDFYFGTNFPLPKIATVKSPRVKLPSLLQDNTTYYWRVEAKNIYSSSTGPTWSFKTARIVHTVSAPDALIGMERGTINKSYTFNKIDLKCNQGHRVEYRYDWGDGTYSDWLNSEIASHAWSEPGIYTVRVQARCSVDKRVISSWSENQTVMILAKTWSTIRITFNPAGLEDPEIAGSGNYLHIIFHEGNILAYKRSTDGGSTWESRQNLSTTGQLYPGSDGFAISADGPYVHVVTARRPSPAEWYKIWYRRNTNYGQSGYWGGWVQITTGPNRFLYPDIIVDGEYVHITYNGNWPGNEEIFYKRISNYGVGSSLTRRLTYSLGGASRFPCIAISSQYVYVAYQDDWPGEGQLFFKRISNYGAGSYDTRRLTHNDIRVIQPDIAAFGQYVFVVFVNFNPISLDTDIFSKTIETYGTGSITTKRLTYAGDCIHPAVAFDSTTNEMQVTYSHEPSPAHDEIFWKVVSNFGKGTYSTYRLTYSTYYSSLFPDILIEGGTIHIVYQDNWPTSYEIFYKRR